VVGMDLFGTAILPISLILLYYLIIVSIFFTNYAVAGIAGFVNLILLFGVLLMPALLVLLTSGKVSYIGWMMIYLLALPIWQIVLPLYAFWNFDDFSWGETRFVLIHPFVLYLN
jgi:chitin synthase